MTTGGAGRDRTGDLLNANQALSQLSYSPAFSSEADWTQGSPGLAGKSPKNNAQNSSGDQNETLHPIHSGLEALTDDTEVGVERLRTTNRSPLTAPLRSRLG